MTSTTRGLVATRNGLFGTDGSTLLEGSVDSVAVDAGETWALVDHRRIHRVGSGGHEVVAELGDGPGAGVICRHRGRTWIGGDEGRLWRLEGSEVVPVGSFDEAPTHAEWHTPWGGPPSVLSMVDGGDDLFVGVHVGGILRTSDGGRSWTDTIDLHTDVHEVVLARDGTVWAATGSAALGRSDDRGATWTFHDEGLHGTYLLTVAATSDGVVVGASSGHAGRDGRLYRFDGSRFEPVEGLPDDLGGAVGPRCLSAAGDHVVVALPDGRCYTSADAGATWTAGAGGFERPSEAVALAAAQP